MERITTQRLITKRPVCLSIGGSDSCGGAGIQADLRVFEALGVKGCSVITALTAQNPQRITRIEPASLAQQDAEIHAIFDAYDVTAVKTGMLLDAEHIAVLAAGLQHHWQAHKALVIDPVMISSSGKRLLAESAVDTLIKALLPMASLITPNLDEAAVLLGYPVNDSEAAAVELAEKLGCAVLLKGGHAEVIEADTMLVDMLVSTDGQVHRFEHLRKPWGDEQRHGTGCRLAAAIAAELALMPSLELPLACHKAISFLQDDAL
ncbi:MAG: bifunctional hydroxymethylpyrimidine kinase/phosphomethylpyrimidine kinase [Zetaproteobacteria bacterium CG_4_9_14_3_um_filter_49_83]|nr:MAG: bifunctional hydroxymethylpyrimidine kinase/phosphomethylpyrimidine kinase [Zetaproteobacteria bacterium CG1_02_49_23]PIQ30345.1 MAG: bifunctional hydroxymethylpyrimidine kinase/phosphomethylpyrimidine kinase [Zetaproteobacteria bacterium CG17_big_fil_post_rev_8_21_14_2_50_50_13]PIV31394.1 MAG: bifunctional hydroxymethylpyrimidine kinase/phosphomethylpyrimidine kinase [Zetaproteobacteria bacterium CG02_land_8_20_14_3_00_50_9]PIY56598.1 MAG: bifunctional hydroxymethylpyrimidine kinase/pho